VIWSPPVALPDWWQDLRSDMPIVYVTLGSTGDPQLLRVILDALCALPVRVILACPIGDEISRLPPNVLSAKYLPGDLAAAMSVMVVCNGGAPTSHQALVAGVPVLGIVSNMDQNLEHAGDH